MLSGIFNDYASITDINYCENTITVNTAFSFQESQQVLVIQMNGGAINSSNTASYGDVEALGSTGLFEKSRIAAVNGNVITLENALLNTYDLNAVIQLVSFPVYEEVIIDEDVMPSVWNGQIGGVLALEVSNTLTLNAAIDASGTGFNGGQGNAVQDSDCDFLTIADDYFYPIANWRGAPKGRGITPLTTGMESGRGPQANGGGGGNDHNSGGGGGANVTAGGRGGENDEPGFFGCDGFFPGLGGKALEAQTNRIFMGGGGGAGHENNDQGTNGGIGGGIIIILANNVVGNNQAVRSNGISPPEVTGDGGSGGGAGGTIIINAENGTGAITIEAKGGAGGTVNNSSTQRCFGPGGGGSGGRLIQDIAPGLITTIDLKGGAAGLTINSSSGSCPDSPANATAGLDGVQEDFEPLVEGTAPNEPPVVVNLLNNPDACTNQSLELSVEATGNQLEYQWQINTSGGFVDLQENPPYSGTQTNLLNIDPVDINMADNLYRVILISSCFEAVISEDISINLLSSPLANFSFTISGQTVDFTNASSNYTDISWNFGDTNSSIQENPSHTYMSEGDYSVVLTATNECGSTTSTMIVSIASPPTAGFTFGPMDGCASLTVNFVNQSSASTNAFAWFFTGGTPSFSLEENPEVVYDTPGTYDVLLIASNAAGVDSLLISGAVTVNDVPTTAFSTTANDLQLSFTNNSMNATSYLWDFGDMNNSTMQNPVHTYATPGAYTISLTATNECGSTEITENILVGAPPNAIFNTTTSTACLPFPIQFTNGSQGTYESLVWFFPGGTPATSTDENPIVTYSAVGQYDVTLTINGILGSSSVTEEGYVTILPVPEPEFSCIQLEEGAVIFNNGSVDAENYDWDFGDGNSSNEESPVHTYSSSGVYTVILNASNSACAKAVTKDIQILLTNVEELVEKPFFNLYPNPSSGMVHLDINNNQLSPLSIQLFTIQGQLIRESVINGNTIIDLSENASGIYLFKISDGTNTWVERVLLNR